MVGEKNVIAEVLINRDEIILPPLLIKLGLMKQFVKAMNKEESCFDYICRKFPVVSMEMLKVELMKDLHIQDSMKNTEVDEQSSFTLVVSNFLRNYKADNSSELVKNMLYSFH